MASKTVSPTRMELTRLKGRLKTASRGHRLLKDKRDEMMRQFMDTVRRNRVLREKVEVGLAEAGRAMAVAGAVMSPAAMHQALMCPRQKVGVELEEKNIMSVLVPRYTFSGAEDQSGMFPYGFAQTSGELDDALTTLQAVFRDMLELAEAEKTTQLLAEEIEKTRRRVNALEYVMIPELQESIHDISMKLEENDRSTKVRLMKVKDMVLREAHGWE